MWSNDKDFKCQWIVLEAKSISADCLDMAESHSLFSDFTSLARVHSALVSLLPVPVTLHVLGLLPTFLTTFSYQIWGLLNFLFPLSILIYHFYVNDSQIIDQSCLAHRSSGLSISFSSFSSFQTHNIKNRTPSPSILTFLFWPTVRPVI